jgi:2-(1,2-epoxy-1,2-dihydrophenyl)acetyl-CoA isomerase|tara:strand:- start:8613 stop:9404 length:792 start_codon:yes stop_codon:yes gene_type:complete
VELTAFKFSIENHVARITLAQGERGNPFDLAFCSDFNKIATECDNNRDVRAVIIDAEGKYFSVGGDLKSLATGTQEASSHFVKAATSTLHMGISRLARMDAPVIFKTDALVAGGAVALASGADFVLAGPNAKFYAAFAGIGFSCDSGSSYYLPRRVGLRRAFSFFSRNEMWSAEQALDYGLVSEIHSSEELEDKSAALANELASGPTYTFGKLKNLFLETFQTPLETQLEMEARALTDCTRTQDTWSAVQAVANKKKAVFEYK